ncbi:MAG: hypothetical protein ACOC4J_00385 [Bacteroidota bacterium]
MILEATLNHLGITEKRTKIKNEIHNAFKSYHDIDTLTSLSVDELKQYVGWVSMFTAREYGVDLDNDTLQETFNKKPIL